MSRSISYPKEYKKHVSYLAQNCSSPSKLSKKFLPSEDSIKNWVQKSKYDKSCKKDVHSVLVDFHKARAEKIESEMEVEHLKLLLGATLFWALAECEGLPPILIDKVDFEGF